MVKEHLRKLSDYALIGGAGVMLLSELALLFSDYIIPSGTSLGAFVVYAFGATFLLVVLGFIFRLPKGVVPESDQKKSNAFLLVIGAILVIFGSGPLLVTLISANMGLTDDPNPNPVLYGMMAMFTFWPGIALVLVAVLNKVKRGRKQSN